MLPPGKLPPELLSRLIASSPTTDPRLLLGPGLGLDCAVVDYGTTLLVFKSDPITFATDQIGWYLVQVTTNDIATTGALPRWLLVTMLLPERSTSPELVLDLNSQITRACIEAGMVLIGGHTEITTGLDRPILVGTVIGEVAPDKLVTPLGARPGNRLMVTKGVPIEATAILARELPDRLSPSLSETEISEARQFLFNPGISVRREARLAVEAGDVTAMHDPTEGGLAGALWELSQACGHALFVDMDKIPIPPISQKICQLLQIDPFAAIASGALLLTAAESSAGRIQAALTGEGIPCVDIGWIEAGSPGVWRISKGEKSLLPRPLRDEIARVFEG